jgi:hypothetical protein
MFTLAWLDSGSAVLQCLHGLRVWAEHSTSRSRACSMCRVQHCRGSVRLSQHPQRLRCTPAMPDIAAQQQEHPFIPLSRNQFCSASLLCRAHGPAWMAVSGQHSRSSATQALATTGHATTLIPPKAGSTRSPLPTQPGWCTQVCYNTEVCAGRGVLVLHPACVFVLHVAQSDTRNPCQHNLAGAHRCAYVTGHMRQT